jgi:hypothetical protein
VRRVRPRRPPACSKCSARIAGARTMAAPVVSSARSQWTPALGALSSWLGHGYGANTMTVSRTMNRMGPGPAKGATRTSASAADSASPLGEQRPRRIANEGYEHPRHEDQADGPWQSGGHPWAAGSTRLAIASEAAGFHGTVAARPGSAAHSDALSVDHPSSDRIGISRGAPPPGSFPQ